MAKDIKGMAKTPIPAIIKRNTALLLVIQALFSGVFQSVVVIAALGIFFFTKSAALSALASSVVIGGRVLVAFSAGRLMDRVGRKTVLYVGVIVICIALVMMASALYSSLVWLFWLGIFIFGTGAGVMNLLRVPLTDMYPASRRGEGMGYFLTGSIVGTFIAPLLSALAPYLAFIGLGTYVLILLISVPVMGIGAIFVKLISPDTKEILGNLKEYYPEEPLSAAPISRGVNNTTFKTTSVTISIAAAFIASAFSWGGMVMDMSIVSIMLQQYGMELTLINLAVSIHVFGMYGLSIPWGWFTDRRGCRIVMALGGIILGAGAFLMPLTKEYLIITFGIFLVGLGWSATNVASTALLSDLTPGPRRGSVFGANDVANGLTSLTFPVLGGAILSSLGFLAFGITGLVIALPVVLCVLPIHEPSH